MELAWGCWVDEYVRTRCGGCSKGTRRGISPTEVATIAASRKVETGVWRTEEKGAVLYRSLLRSRICAGTTPPVLRDQPSASLPSWCSSFMSPKASVTALLPTV